MCEAAKDEDNKETFESAGGFMYIARQQKEAVGYVTAERGQSVCSKIYILFDINSYCGIHYCAFIIHVYV